MAWHGDPEGHAESANARWGGTSSYAAKARAVKKEAAPWTSKKQTMRGVKITKTIKGSKPGSAIATSTGNYVHNMVRAAVKGSQWKTIKAKTGHRLTMMKAPKSSEWVLQAVLTPKGYKGK